MRNPVIAKALRLRNSDDLDWVDLYRLYEVIKSDVGRLIHQLGWARHDELQRFSHTANSVAATGDKGRHGVERSRPPSKPVSLSDARELIDRILLAWLAYKKNLPKINSTKRALH
jgi:hypothetical protein